MKRFLFILLLAGIPLAGQGQGIWKNALQKAAAGQKAASHRVLVTKNAGKILAARKKASIQKAQTACQGNMSGCVLYGESPIKKIKGWPFLFSSSGPFDNNEILKSLSRSAKKDYFVAAHNRAAAKAVAVRKQALERMQGEKIKLTNGFYSPVKRNSPAQELAALMNDQYKYIFLGEMHHVPAIQKEVEQFLVQYRSRYPDKQVIFLTEFLPNTQTREYRRRLSRVLIPYADIWRTAEVLKMPVVGLDPVWLFKHNSPIMWVFKDNSLEKEQMWYSLEITRQRNQLWRKTIEALRAKYPKAVFIFHTGATHVEYNEPFSLGRDFPKEETFVATFYPYERHGNWVSRCDLLDAFNPTTFSWRKMIVWKNADLARVAGFNARFKVPDK